MAIKWIKTGTKVTSEGRTTTYKGEGTPLTIESRLRHVLCANGIDTWDCTTYVVVKDGEDVAEKHRLMDAKEYAEALIGGAE